MQQGNLSLVRGDDQVVGVTVLTPSGTPYNLSGCLLVFTAHQNENYFSPSWLIETTTGHLSPVDGLSQIAFPASGTAGLDDLNHYYDIKLYSQQGTITTLIYGLFNLLPS